MKTAVSAWNRRASGNHNQDQLLFKRLYLDHEEPVFKERKKERNKYVIFVSIPVRYPYLKNIGTPYVRARIQPIIFESLVLVCRFDSPHPIV